MIKVEFWDDEKLATISIQARHTYIGMWTQSDDNGNVKGSLSWLQSKIYPYDTIADSVFKKWIDELVGLKRIAAYEVNGEQFFTIKNFLKHQTINRPSKYENPKPNDRFSERSVINHVPINDEVEVEVEQESVLDTPFDRFYEAYPGKKNHLRAVKEWTQHGCAEKADEVMAGLEAQIQERELLKKHEQFVPEWPNANNWLREKRWGDTVKSEDDIKPKDYINPDSEFNEGLNAGRGDYSRCENEEEILEYLAMRIASGKSPKYMQGYNVGMQR